MISNYNYLYVVGCNVEVYMFGDNMTDLIGACMSTCIDNTETMERANLGRYCGGIVMNEQYSLLAVMSELSTVRCDRVLGL